MKYLAILISVGGCASISTPVDFCAVYEPVPTLHCGSATQQLAIDKNNAVYLEFCGR